MTNPPKISTISSYPQKYLFFFLKPLKILKFKMLNQKMVQAYVYMRISEYPPPSLNHTTHKSSQSVKICQPPSQGAKMCRLYSTRRAYVPILCQPYSTQIKLECQNASTVLHANQVMSTIFHTNQAKMPRYVNHTTHKSSLSANIVKICQP